MDTLTPRLTCAWNHLRSRLISSHHGLAIRLCLVLIASACLLLAAGCATTPPTEESVIARMQSPNAEVAVNAMLQYEKTFPTSTNGFAVMKGYLNDPRASVRRKAARVLGVLHAPVSEEDINAICNMLNSSDPAEVIDALKSLRGLNAPSAVDKILPLLERAYPNILRDSCRTLAVLGNKDLIPKIEPLLSHPEPAVQKDAQDAIFKLRGK